MSDFYLFFMLFTALACGWAIAHWQMHARNKERGMSRDNYELPYYFSTDIPDHALDAFISAVDVNADTLETHLTLGALHRQRGELERAIRIHENLLRRDGLTANQVSLAKFELALDYVNAGLFDRAEEFLQELVEKSDFHRVSALYMLIDLYQDEREWLKASYAANVLFDYLDKKGQKRLTHIRSHFYCEQAEQAIDCKDYLSARRSIKQAEQQNPNGKRPVILMASLEFKLGHVERAKLLLDRLISQSDDLQETSLLLLKKVCGAMSQPDHYRKTLEQIYRKTASSDVLILLFRELLANDQQDLLLDIIRDVPPIDLGRMPISVFSEIDVELMVSLSSQWLGSVRSDSDSDRLYQCDHCGFDAREYHWQCPSCRHWETLRTRSPLNA